jgi:hypothetical protein
MRFHWILLAAVATPLLPVRAADDLARYSVISVAPARTSIYIGRLTVTPGPFERTPTGYRAALGVDVAPFFYHDDARVVIDVPEVKVRELKNGKAIAFTGRVIRKNGQFRRVTGTATPTGESVGNIDIRVYLTSRMIITFSTTYKVAAPAQ